MSESKHRICILGGGFGGLYTALRLSQLPWDHHGVPEITLVDQRDRFLFTPLLYELLTDELQTWEIAPPFSEILADTSIEFVQGTVTDLNVKRQQVQIADQPSLNYDSLVLAMGGKTPMEMVPGAQEFAFPFHSLKDAYQLEEKLRSLENSDREKIRIAIVGGGYSGVELACKLRDRVGDRGRIRIIERGELILKTSPDFNRETARKALVDRDVWMDTETSVERITADEITLLYKGQSDTIPVDIVAWTVGTTVPELVKNLDLPHHETGKIKVEPTLQVEGHPAIFALGDLAFCQDGSGKVVPATAQVAFQQSDYCAWNLWATLTGRPLLPFKYYNLGEMLVLGTDNASLTSQGVKLDGIVAYLARRLAYLSRMPTPEHQLTVGSNWITQPLSRLLSNV
ncbi:FAD-dependent pyridine nucleotide-disulfide oxidoreductase [Halothece sp. PCC 7418]|uniref:NAD(P)/FAD-dependent oxidoreductase n=1 Tax=Halothece sp. (strain PCC 7418) TaxID=65093 RepID=UPI0002A08A2B|nr:NAD(P)/FAD-dependent oxidoreductase [Halothece sp. PCC 7418]AFZ44366.1 FAD-dependent pyridine nucleotide-disulfide oxidoreductase [Halothece sp. PCC 7418]